MSGPVRPPLTVAESDGTPTIRPCSTISFNSADFVVVDNGTTARIDAHPGAGASLTDTEIAFGDAANLMDSSSVFTYTTPGTLPTVTIGDSTLQDAGGNFKLTGKDNIQILTNSTYGSIKFYPATGGTSAMNIDYIGGVTINPTGSATGDLVVSGDTVTNLLKTDSSQDNVGIGGAPDSAVERLEILGTGSGTLVRLTSTDAGATNAPDLELFRDSPSPASGDFTGAISFSGYEDTGATSKVDFGRIDVRMFGHDATESGVLGFYTRQNNALRPQIMLKQTGFVYNENNEAAFDFQIETSGSANTVFVDSGLDLVGVGLVPLVNDGILQVSSSDELVVGIKSSHSIGCSIALDATGTDGDEWRLVSGASGAGIGGGNFGLYNVDEATYVWTAGEDGVVGIGAFPGSGDVNRLHVQTDAVSSVVQRWETTAVPTPTDFAIKLEVMASGTPLVNGAGLGCIDFIGDDSGGAQHTYARMSVTMADKGAGTEDSVLKFECVDGGTDAVEHLTMGNGRVRVNESKSNVDFMVSSDANDRLLCTDASFASGVGAVVIGNVTAVTGGAMLQVDEDASFLCPYSTDASATVTLTDAQCHNGVVHLTYDTAAQAVTLPTAVSGMSVTVVRQQATNAPTIVAAAGEKVNGVAAPSTVSISAQYGVIVLHGITGTGWVGYEPAVAA